MFGLQEKEKTGVDAYVLMYACMYRLGQLFNLSHGVPDLLHEST